MIISGRAKSILTVSMVYSGVECCAKAVVRPHPTTITIVASTPFTCGVVMWCGGGWVARWRKR